MSGEKVSSTLIYETMQNNILFTHFLCYFLKITFLTYFFLFYRFNK